MTIPPAEKPCDPVSLLAHNLDAFADRPALAAARQSLSYGDLKRRIGLMAAWLGGCGIAAGMRVGIAVDEPVLFCELVLAVAWVGAVYVPIETAAFPARARVMIGAAGLGTVICRDAAIAAHCADLCAVAMVPRSWPGGASPVAPVARPAGAAFNIMFTSGSSGTPKGVICPAGGIVPLVCGDCHVPLQPSDRVLQVSARSFDAFTWELWGSLLNGACLVMAPPSWSIRSIARFIAAEGITAAFFTSRLFDALIDAEPGPLAGLRLIAFGGESASPKHCETAVALLPAVRLFNVYGPSENTSFTTSHRLDAATAGAARVPIGGPAGGDLAWLADPETGDLVTGAGRGELLVGGPGLALGYTDPALTERRFIIHPALGQRLFRTGDLVARDPSGCYVWLGRLDREVKVRGRRVDLGEVERALAEVEGVSFAAVLHNVLEQGEVIAFYATATGEPLPSGHIFRALAARMGAQALPRHLEFVRDVPLNAHGKADRDGLARALTDRLRSRNDRQAIAGLWARYLPVQALEATTDFFREGGDSLAALNLAIDVERLTGIPLDPGFIARHSTFGAFCEMLALEASRPERASAAAAADPLFVFLPALREQKLAPYLHLVAALDEASSLVLDYRQIFARGAPATLEAFSRACAECIAAAAPRRVVLVGHSIAGSAALDVAVELERCKVDVSLVVLLDSFTAAARTAHRLRCLAGKALEPFAWARRARWLARRGPLSPEREGLSEASAAIFELGRHVGGWLEPLRLRPRIPATPRIVLFKAVHASQPADLRAVADNGWRRSIPRLEVRRIDMEHAALLDHLHAPEVASLLLAEAED